MSSKADLLLALFDQWYRAARQQSALAVANLEEATRLIDDLTAQNNSLRLKNGSLTYELSQARQRVADLERKMRDLPGTL